MPADWHLPRYARRQLAAAADAAARRRAACRQAECKRCIHDANAKRRRPLGGAVQARPQNVAVRAQ